MKRLIALIVLLAVVATPVSAQKKETYRVRTVVIDPGHGGAKPGAQGAKTQEKVITLAIAKKFGKLLEDNYPDVKVIYTRTTDVDISLAERAHIANRNKADLFISIHANSHPTSSPTGVETFVMGLSESRANLEVAKTENADILLEADYKKNDAYKGFDPNAPESFVMLAMFQNAYLDKSLNLAQAIQNQYKQHLKTINRGVKQAELFVLYKTSMPSVLTEVGFISNPAEEAFMMSEEGQAQIALCLFNAFMNFKSTEEGTPRIANPVINIKGYKAPQEEQPAPKEPLQEERPAAAEPPQEVATTPAPPAAKPVVEPVQEPVALPEAVEVPAVAIVTTPDAERPLPGAELAPRQQETPPVAEEPAPAPEVQRPINSAAADAAQYYTVQFLTSAELLPPGSEAFGGLEEVESYRNGKLYCYSVGRFATFQEANVYCKEIRETTRFKDAWALLRKEAVPAAAETPAVQARPAKGAVEYRIQFCTGTHEMKAGDPALQGIKEFRCAKSGKLYVYTTGSYTTRAEAVRACAELKKSTRFKDAFVVAFRDGERVQQ